MSIREMVCHVVTGHPLAMAASERNQAVGRRLQRLREDRQWSMGELAIRCGGAQVTPSQINKLEKGRQQFTVDWLYRLSDALECDVCELLADRRYPEAEALSRILQAAEPHLEALRQIVGTAPETAPGDPDADSGP